MTKIIFKYAAMSAGKSLDLIKVAYNYQERNMETVVLKPKTDTRIEEKKIYSRAGLEWECEFVDEFIESIVGNNKTYDNIVRLKNIECIMVDEAQFLTEQEVNKLVSICYQYDIKALMLFGLLLDFQGKLFPGSKRIVEVMDTMEEVQNVCWCGKKARKTARVINGQIATQGETIIVEKRSGNEATYVPLCNYHYYTKDLGEK